MPELSLTTFFGKWHQYSGTEHGGPSFHFIGFCHVLDLDILSTYKIGGIHAETN